VYVCVYSYTFFIFCRIQLLITCVLKTAVSQFKHGKQKSLYVSVNMYAVEQIINAQCVNFRNTSMCRFPRSALLEFPASHFKNKKSSHTNTPHTHTITRPEGCMCNTDFTCVQIPSIHKFVKITGGSGISHKNAKYTVYKICKVNKK
jgi:hypothetical protein